MGALYRKAYRRIPDRDGRRDRLETHRGDVGQGRRVVAPHLRQGKRKKWPAFDTDQPSILPQCRPDCRPGGPFRRPGSQHDRQDPGDRGRRRGHRGGDVARHQHQRDGLLFGPPGGGRRRGRGKGARAAAEGRRGHIPHGARLHDHGRAPGRLAQGSGQSAGHRHRSRASRLGRGGGDEESLPPLPAARLHRPAALRGDAPSPALVRIHRRRHGGDLDPPVAKEIERLGHRGRSPDRRSGGPGDRRWAVGQVRRFRQGV